MKPTVDEVLRRVRAESARGSSADLPTVSAPTRWLPAAARLPVKREYTLHEMLSVSDADFVDTAYQVLMRRPADSGGREFFLRALRDGSMTKVEILAALRWSEEGRARSVHVDGLLAPTLVQRARRAPIIGPLVSWALALLQLGAMHQRMHSLDALHARETHELGRQFNQLADWSAGALAQQAQASAESVRGVSAEIADLRQLQAQQAQASRDGDEQLAQRHQGLSETLAQVHQDLSETLAQVHQGLSDTLAQLQASVTDAARQQAGLTTRLARAELERAAADARIAALDVHGKEAAAHVDALRLGIESALQGLDLARQSMAATSQQLAGLQALAERIDGAKAGLDQWQAGMDQLHALDRSVAEQRLAGLDLERRLRALAPIAGATMAAPSQRVDNGPGVDPSAFPPTHLDQMYASMEERFRGEREVIKRRAAPYLGFIRDAGAGTEDAPVLDLGCGRGEWLELLGENDLVGSGVDLNEVFINQCRERGLSVHHADVIAHLRGLRDASVGAVTSMHLVEHLPLEVMVELLDQAMRVLRPDGLLILETPNPENLMVGSHYFYMDPTHRNPLPPTLLEWLVQARGFRATRVERLREDRGQQTLPGMPGDAPGGIAVNRFVDLMNAAADYAVVASK